MNFPFLKSVIGGTWHVDARTYFELMPMRNMILQTGMQFEKGEPEAGSLPYYIAAENYTRFNIETAPESEEYVSVVVLSGAMTKHDQYCGGYGTQSIMNFLLRGDRQRNVIGQVLYVDSGGGQTISLDPFRDEFHNLKKPVVGFVENVAASAGMGAISFAQEIYASKPKAVLGSIGTMIAFDGHPANTTSSDGIRHVRLYASKSVNKNGDFEKALNGNFKPLVENTLNPINEEFISMIQANRPAVTDAYCDGQDYYAENVVGTLIDGIQGFEATVDRVVQLAKQGKSDTGNKSQNHKLMSNSNQFKALASFSGYPTLEVDSTGHITLQQAAAEKVNNVLTTIKEASAIREELKQAKATIAARDGTIAELKNKIAELEKQPGASSSTAHTSSDEPDIDPLSVFSVDNEATTEELLNAFKSFEE